MQTDRRLVHMRLLEVRTMSDMDWLIFFETSIPRWWCDRPRTDISPLKDWFLWTETREVHVDDPASLAYPPGRINEIFFRMVLDQQYGRGTVDPFLKIYEKVRHLGDLREIRHSICEPGTLIRLAKEGGGHWRFRRIPLDLIDNADLVVRRTESASFEKYLHQIVAQILGTRRFRFPEVEVGETHRVRFAQQVVTVLLSPQFKLRSVGQNMASYALRHLAQIPGSSRLFKADYHNLKLGTREEVEDKLELWSRELLARHGDRMVEARHMFSPAVLNMAIYVRGVLERHSPHEPAAQDSRPPAARPSRGNHEQHLERLSTDARAMARNVITTVKLHLPGVVEKPTQGYLGLKHGGALICAIYPHRDGFLLGHRHPASRGSRGDWLTPLIQTETDLEAILPRILERVDPPK